MLATTNNMTIQVYGSESEIDTFASRIKLMVKGGAALSNGEARALAQISRVTNLNPFIGEVWYIPGKGPMIGIAGARRLFNEGNSENGYAYVELIPCSPEEAGVPAESLKDVHACYQCEAHSSAATREYLKMITEAMQAMREAGSTDPFGDARQVVGKKPIWQGWGYSTKSETSRMNKTALAKKRAEADALKKRIVVPFGLPDVQVSVHEDYIDAQSETIQEQPKQKSIVEDEDYPAELIVESVQPAPVKSAVKLVPNETITDSEWEQFGKLLQSAHNAGLVVMEYNRASMTAEKLNGVTNYIRQEMAKK
jgi:hypothetical protein